MAGWDIPEPKGNPLASSKVSAVGEILFAWPQGADPPKHFKVLWDAFIKAGWDLGGASSADVPPNTVLIIVGPRI